MKLLLFLLLVTLSVCSVTDESQGITATIGLDFINKVKDHYFEKIMTEINNINLPDISEGSIKASNINFKLKLPSKDSIQVSFDSKNQGLKVSIKDLYAELHGKWRFKKSFLKLNGKFNVKGTFDEIAVTLGYGTQNKDGFLIPSIHTKSTTIKVQEKKWKIDVGKNILQKVVNQFIKLFKGKGIKSMKKELGKQLDNKVPSLLNEELRKAMPIEMPITDWMNINIATPKPIQVTENSLSVTVNGTVFAPGKSQNIPTPSFEPKLLGKAATSDIMVSAGNHVSASLANTINTKGFHYEIEEAGIKILIDVPQNEDRISLTNTDKGLHVVASALCTIVGANTTMNIDISADVSFNFTNGDDKNMLYVNPYLDKDSLEVKTSKTSFIADKISEGLMNPIFDYIIKYFVKHLKLDPVPVKKVDGFPFVLVHSSTEFSPEHILVGLHM